MVGTSSFAVLTISSFVVLTLISPSAHAQTNGDPVPQVRMKWQDFVSGPDGTKQLASLQKAVAKMKSLDNAPSTSADFRRSWTYWANIHGYLGPQSKFQTLAYQKDRLVKLQMSQFLPYLVGTTDKPGFKVQTPPRMWSCWQHSHPNEQPGDWQNQQFSFVDENGAQVTRSVKDFLDTKALGYVYDNESSCTRTAAPQIVTAQADEPKQMSSTQTGSKQPITLKSSDYIGDCQHRQAEVERTSSRRA